MKKLLFLTAALFVFSFAYSQPDSLKNGKKWTKSGTASVNMSQSSFNNWSAGGDNSVSGIAALGYKTLYKNKKHIWETSFDAAYGLTYQDSEKRKNEDRFEIDSKYGYELKKSWYLSSLVQFKTQFDKGYDSYPKAGKPYTSKMFAPAYLTVMPFGIDFRPDDAFSLTFSPLTARFTFVCDDTLSDIGAFGVDKGKKVKSELGAFFKVAYNKTFMEKIVLKTKLELFSPYTDEPLNMNVNWELNVAYKIAKWFSTSFYSQLLYDNNAKSFDAKGVRTHGARVQFKQVLGMGVSFIF